MTPSGSDETDAPAGAPTGLVILDERGELFNRIRQMDLGTAIWRTLRAPGANEILSQSIVLLLAAYGEPDWSTIWEIARRFPTIVAAHPTSAQDALRALQAGAFGYIDRGGIDVLDWPLLPADRQRRAGGGCHGPARPHRGNGALSQRRRRGVGDTDWREHVRPLQRTFPLRRGLSGHAPWFTPCRPVPQSRGVGRHHRPAAV